ncbi:MAG: PKD domain-containing protein [bacterium]|nr:PKD domain-containing protein [bacterium]
MRKLIILILLIFILFQLKAQHGDNWALGLFSGIRFTKDGVTKIKTKISLDTTSSSLEPTPRSVSFSDCNSQLLIYGGTAQLWNKHHYTLKNGFFNGNQIGNFAQFYSTLLVPLPNSSRYLYYFNHAAGGPNPTVNDSFMYNIIDLNQDNGNGILIKKNTLNLHKSNNLTYTMHANARDIWILQGYDDRTLYAYLLTDTGLITTPIVSNNIYMGQISYPYWAESPNPRSHYRFSSGITGYNGNIKVSNDRSKLISTGVDTATTKLGCVWEYNFDNSTGQASNGKVLLKYTDIPNYTFVGNILSSSISTNDTFYYFASYGENIDPSKPRPNNVIWQYNRNTGKKTRLITDKKIYTDFQLGPDGKIYFMDFNYPNTNLYRIKYPNKEGIECYIEFVFTDSSYFAATLPSVYQPYRPLYYYSNLDKSPCMDTAEFELHVDTNFRQLTVFYGDGDSIVYKKPLNSVYKLKHKYHKIGTYFFRLQALNPVCNSYTYAGDSIFTALIPKHFNLQKSITPQCNYSQLNLRDSFVNTSLVIYQWQDNTSDTMNLINSPISTNSIHEFDRLKNPSNGIWNLKISNKECKDFKIEKDSINLKYLPFPKIGFIANTSSINDSIFIKKGKQYIIGCEPLELIFRDTTPSLKQGSITSTKTQYYTYNKTLINQYQVGDFSIILVDTNTSNCVATDTFYISVHESPKIKFTLTNSKQCLKNNKFKLLNSSLSITDSTTYSLNWGDGDSVFIKSNEQISHTFVKSGNYQTRLIGESSKGCINKFDTMLIVYPNGNALFEINNDSQCYKNNLFKLTNKDTHSVKNYWQYGDKNTDSSLLKNDVSHHYDKFGNYLILHITTTSNNCNDTASKTIKVLESPIIKFSIKDTFTCLPSSLFSYSTNSTYSNTNKLIHIIDYADNRKRDSIYDNGGINTFYSKPGIYSVMAICIANNGCSDTAIKRFNVIQPVFVKLSASRFCLGDTLIATAKSSAGETFSWKLNNSSLPNKDSVLKIIPPTIGLYKIAVSAHLKECLGKDSINVTIIDKPNVDFVSRYILENKSGYLFHFKDLTQNANKWHWTFGNQGMSNLQNPDFVFNDTGYTPIKLKVSNQSDCTDSIEKQVRIFASIPFYFPNVITPDNNGMNDAFGLNPNQYNLVKYFHLEIYNRWGERVFETNDVSQHWIMTNNSKGETPQGVYMYKVIIENIYDIKIELSGAIEVLK